MPIIKNIQRFKEDQFRNKRIIAIDFGERKFGIALSDAEQKIATPKLNFKRKDKAGDDVSAIKELINQYEVGIIVFGLPKTLDNLSQQSTEKMKSFANLLSQNIEIPIFYWDERFTSVTAKQIASHKEFKGEDNDKIAASLILQGVLEFLSS